MIWAVCAAYGEDIGASIKDYGPITYINHRYIYIDEIDDQGHMPHSFMHNLRRAAEKFDPEEDYLLLVGDHLQLVTFAMMVHERMLPDEDLRVLRYDRKAHGHAMVRTGT